LTQYKAITGNGSSKKKADFRAMIAAQKLGKASASQTNTQASTQADTTIGTYRNFWVIAEKEGGLMDKETGMRAARSICSHCEKKGAPFLMWDEVAGLMKFLHCELGVSDVQTKTRKSILQADIDMDEDCIRMAMKQGLADGLSPKIPPDQWGKIHGASGNINNVPPGSFGEPKLQPDAVKIGVDKTITPTAQAPTEQPDLAKQIAGLDIGALAKQLVSNGIDSGQSLVSAVLLQQLINQNTEPPATDATAQASESANVTPNSQMQAQAKASGLAQNTINAVEGNDRTCNQSRGDKNKAPEEKLWRECYVLGNKLNGMTTHGLSIVALAAEDGNDWIWAKAQTSELATIIDNISDVVFAWSSSIRTSTLGYMLQKKGSKEALISWLQDIKVEIVNAMGEIETPLGVLIGMHSIRLKKSSRKHGERPSKKVKIERTT
jgi:hypothetical protein